MLLPALKFLKISLKIEHFKSKWVLVYQADDDSINIYSLRQKRSQFRLFKNFNFLNKSLKINGFKHPIPFGIEIAL
jgi:hypothetical protein